LASDAEPDAASFLPSGQASTADSGNGHSEEEEVDRFKATPGGGSRPTTRTGDFRFDLPPPPPPLLTHYGGPIRSQGSGSLSRTQGSGGPVHRVAPIVSNSSTCSSFSKPPRSTASSRLPSFTPSPDLSRGVRKFFASDPSSFSGPVPLPPTAQCLSSWSTTLTQPCPAVRDDVSLSHARTNFDNDVIV